MRLLHTADWHLGRAFHGESLLAAQAAAVDHVVEVARAERVDAVLIAGDLYDRALPPVDAVRLADEALSRLGEVCPVVVISGNHDSAARLGFGASLLDRAGVHVRTAIAAIAEPVPVAGAHVYAIPYLEPDLVRAELGAQERGHAAVLAAAMERVRARLDGTPSVVMAHAFVAGAVPSGSERELAVGGASSVELRAFTGVDYVALGHLHGPQRIGSNARYAGSPVAFSFGEAGQEKSLAIVELGSRARDAQLVPFPVWRPLAVVRGELESLLRDPAHAPAEHAWVQATLTDPVRPEDAMERLRRRFPHAVSLIFEPAGADAQASSSYARRLAGLDDGALLERFVEDVRGVGAADEESALLEEALAAGRVAELSG
jgi:exonuclease SbcD